MYSTVQYLVKWYSDDELRASARHNTTQHNTNRARGLPNQMVSGHLVPITTFISTLWELYENNTTHISAALANNEC